jgi:membrane associated rhomboid family serine protease
VVLPIRDENPTSRTPYITIALIAINLFVYFVVQPHSGSDASQSFLFEHAAIPCELTTGSPLTQADIVSGRCNIGQDVGVRTQFGLQRIPDQELAPDKNIYFAVLASMFMHGSVAHVLGNMLFLWIFGNNVEDRLRPLPYLVFYLAAGAVATAAFVALNWHSTVPLVGASGAIAGVMGAYLIWFPRTRVLSLVGFLPVYLPAVFVLGMWFVLQFFTNPNEGVAWQAHVGGFLTGVVVAFALQPRFRRPAPGTGPPGPPPGWGDWDGGFRGGYPGRL